MGIENSQDLWTSVPSTLNDSMRQKQVINKLRFLIGSPFGFFFLIFRGDSCVAFFEDLIRIKVMMEKNS